MPMKRVMHWLPNPGTTVNTQILGEISQCIESLHGVKEGRWKAVLTFYKPMLRDQSTAAEFPRDFLGLSLSEQPEKYYFIIRGHRLVLEADSSIQTIMDRLQSYKQRVSLIFEGTQYKMGDFQVRVGKVTPSMHENMRGIVMEVEYLPISSIETCRLVMDEFVDILRELFSERSLPGVIKYYEPSFAEYGLSDLYTAQHTAVQYGTVTASLIATGQSTQPMRN